jgi:hypothetical protein
MLVVLHFSVLNSHNPCVRSRLDFVTLNKVDPVVKILVDSATGYLNGLSCSV